MLVLLVNVLCCSITCYFMCNLLLMLLMMVLQRCHIIFKGLDRSEKAGEVG